MLGTVVPLELPSALGPPFTIAVAIVETGQDWCPDGQPPDRERKTAEMYLSWVPERYENRVRRDAGYNERDGEKDHWGQLQSEGEKVGSRC